MKKFLGRSAIFGVLMTFLLVFSACSSDEGSAEIYFPTPPPRATYDEYTVISMGWWGGPLRHERTLEVIRMFEEQNPGIRFEPEYFNMDGYISNLRTRAASGDMWDIFQLGSNFPEFADHILCLRSLTERGYIDVTNTTQEMLNLTTGNGNLVGISLGVNSWGIAYDVAMFEELGLPRPHPAWTWADFEHAALTIRGELDIWGVGSFPQEGISLTQYLNQKGTPFFHSTSIHQLNIQSPEPMVSFLQMMQNLVQYRATPDPREALNIPYIEADPMVIRESGMTYLASNQFISLAYAALEIDPTRDLAMVILPGHVYGGATAIVSSQMLSIFNGSENIETAARFVSFFVNDIDANLVLQGERGVPIMSHVRDALEDHGDPVVSATNAFISEITYVRETIMETAAIGGVSIANPARTRIEDYMSATIERVVMGVKTPEEGAQAIFDFAMAAVAAN
jgi:multiple sugar transport system substrate-binding protein